MFFCCLKKKFSFVVSDIIFPLLNITLKIHLDESIIESSAIAVTVCDFCLYFVVFSITYEKFYVFRLMIIDCSYRKMQIFSTFPQKLWTLRDNLFHIFLLWHFGLFESYFIYFVRYIKSVYKKIWTENKQYSMTIILLLLMFCIFCSVFQTQLYCASIIFLLS